MAHEWTTSMQQTVREAPYADLGPGTVLDAVESVGLQCDGRLLPLNSYENRVYQIGLEERAPVIGKFYREGRWSDEAILEEHTFTAQLRDHEIPVVAPLAFDGTTLHTYNGYRFALFPRQGGRLPDLDNPEARRWLGRFLGRLHLVGEVQPFVARPTLTVARLGRDPVRYIVDHGLLPSSLETAYTSLASDVLERIEAAFARAGRYQPIRVHGDCHPGNILWTDDGPHFVDLDDAMNGPAIQDLWMLLSGERVEMTRQLDEILEGYEDFYSLDPRQLHLLEPLRTLRMIHFSYWLALRWNDPAFPPAFPWFASERYWEEQVLALREQAALLDDAPLQL